MHHITRAVLMAVPLLIGTAVVPQAQAHWRGGPRPGPYGYGDRWHGGHHDHTGAIVGGILGGLAVGAVGGAMLAQPYGPPPPPQVVYAPPPPVTYVQPRVAYGPPPPPPVAVYPGY